MSQYYQKTKNNPYRMPDNVYRQVTAIIQRYDEICKQRDDIMIMDAERIRERHKVLSEVSKKIKAVDQTAVELKEKYHKTYTGEAFNAYEAFKDYGVFCRYRSKQTKDIAPCKKTWMRYRKEFTYKVAKKLNYF